MGLFSCREAWPLPWSGLPLALVTTAIVAINVAFPLSLASAFLGDESTILASAILIIVGGALLFVAGGKEAVISGKSITLRYGLLEKIVNLSDVVELSDVSELSEFTLARHVPGLLLMVAASILSGWITLYWALSTHWNSPLALFASLAGATALQHALTVMALSPSGGRRLGVGHLVSVAASLITLATSALAPNPVRTVLIVTGVVGLTSLSLTLLLPPSKDRKLLLIKMSDGTYGLVIGDDDFRQVLLREMVRGD